MDNKKNNEKAESFVEPIVFVNNPIEGESSDVIGFKSQIELLKQAINENASMIGIIADYGSGKSSLTSLLDKSTTSDFEPSIKINMWDSLVEEKGNDSKGDISYLTKSFLFQLANGHSKGLANYVNKALSKNFGNISFSVSNWKNVKKRISIALTLVVMYLLSKMSNTGLSTICPCISQIAPIIRIISPIFLVTSIYWFFKSFENINIAFSHWNMQPKSHLEINDVLDVYRVIADNILQEDGTNNKKRLVFIEDLDRINDEQDVLKFLKELYRFQEVISDKKERIVFIVSLMPEQKLIGKVDDEDALYPKIFDLTVQLKPIHFDDYDTMLLELIKSEPEKRERLEHLIGEEIDSKVPISFKWIKYGTNLTLRDIKDRLNKAINIMVTLKNKSYQGNSSANFMACSAVSFLECAYPQCYYSLVKNEEGFAEFMRKSYQFVNSNASNSLELLKSEFRKSIKNFPSNALDVDFIALFCGMVIDKIFNDDFRMYFYSYPKGSHIKTTEERMLCNCLIYPNQYEIPKDLNDYVERAYSEGENKTVGDVLKTLNEFPEIVIKDFTLFNHSAKISLDKTFAVFKKEVILSSEELECWKDVIKLDVKFRDAFIKKCILEISSLSVEKIAKTRVNIIEELNDDILKFKDLFVGNPKTPFITESEINLIQNFEQKIKLIDIEKIEVRHKDYIFNVINSTPTANNNAINEKVEKIIDKLIEVSATDDIGRYLLEYLKLNNIANDKYFELVCTSDTDINDIVQYLNMFEGKNLSHKYMELIDNLKIYNQIKPSIIVRLLDNSFYRTPIAYCCFSGEMNLLKPYLKNSEEIISACKDFLSDDESIIFTVRSYCIFTVKDMNYMKLFLDDFPFVTDEEYKKFDNTHQAIKSIDTNNIESLDVEQAVSILQSRTYEPKELVSLFNYLFNYEINENCIQDAGFICSIIDEMNFVNLNIRACNEKQRASIYNSFKDTYVIDSADTAINFTKHIGCFISEVEQIIAEASKYESAYCDLIKELDELSEISLKWAEKNYITIALSEKLSNKLYEVKDYQNYIITTILRDGRMIMDENIPFSDYEEVYIKIDKVFDVMSDHWDFLRKLADEGNLENLPEEKLIPIFKVEQVKRFTEFILLGENIELKKKYIREFYKFKDKVDSIAFQKAICRPENIKLVDSEELKKAIDIKLWDDDRTHKGIFTKKWKKMWKETHPECNNES